MFFQSRFFDLLFLLLYIFSKMVDLGAPIRNPMGVKMATKIDQAAPTIAKNLIVQRQLRDPGFHETMVITVPLGHRGF